MFYQTFIAKDIPEELQGRKLIEATIRHLLNWLLTADIFENNPESFAFFSLTLYDFLFMLDIGSTAEFFEMVDSIMNHKVLIDKYKCLVLLRVSQSNKLAELKISTKEGESRASFLLKMREWLKGKKESFLEYNQCVASWLNKQEFIPSILIDFYLETF